MRGDRTSRGSPVPGPTGSTWASERSDERHAQRGAPSREPVGTDPKTGLPAGSPLLFNLVGNFKLFSVSPYDV